MAEIRLHNIRHSYLPHPKEESHYSLKRLSLDWQDGGAYALLGPSGCGKTTLLNIISGILTPSEGQIFFNDTDVTHTSPEKRNIAQVFQFPVIYDTMTIYDNLAFPLRNRGVDEATIKTRVHEIAEMLDLNKKLHRRATGLSADGKQKISLGRGLVRSNVNVIMFDEPLTVIDPHLKWQLRSKLKELHQRTKRTMIYVTHDQTEALTFADQVVVMNKGEVVQTGTPVELFNRPMHTFVGHFIGSPGMNILPIDVRQGQAFLTGEAIATDNAHHHRPQNDGTQLELGVRPEFISFADKGHAVEVVRAVNTGRFHIVEVRSKAGAIKLLVPEGKEIPNGQAFITFDPKHSQIYREGWIVGPDHG